jgi:MoxR-like ATPase
MPSVAQLQSLEQALNQACLERAEVIRGALIALVAREHILLVGTPGSAKSMLSRLIAKALHAEYFEALFHPLMKPEEVFGPFSAKGMLDDKFIRIVQGYLPTAEIAFGDEIFKASVSLRQTILNILNERQYNNGGKVIPCPLRTFFAASNELPTSANDAAFYDRLALRFEVNQIQEDDNALLLFTGLPQVKMPSISKAAIAEMDLLVHGEVWNATEGCFVQTQEPGITVHRDTADTLVEIRREIANEQIFVSDRKWRQTAKLLKAAAYLDGKSEVTPDHFNILNAIIWNTPDQRPKVRKIVGKHGNPLGEKILALQDAFAEVVKDMKRPKEDEKHIELHDALSKMRITVDKFQAMKKEYGQNEGVSRAFEICRSQYNKHLAAAMGKKESA